MALLDAVFADKPGATPQDVARRRKLAEMMLKDAGSTKPITHPLQGIAQMLQAGVGAYQQSRADREEAAGKQQAADANRAINRSLGDPSQGALPKPSEFIKQFGSASGGIPREQPAIGQGVAAKRRAVSRLGNGSRQQGQPGSSSCSRGADA